MYLYIFWSRHRILYISAVLSFHGSHATLVFFSLFSLKNKQILFNFFVNYKKNSQFVFVWHKCYGAITYILNYVKCIHQLLLKYFNECIHMLPFMIFAALIFVLSPLKFSNTIPKCSPAIVGDKKLVLHVNQLVLSVAT